MKILFVTWKFPSISETPLLDQISRLIDLGHDVNILAVRYGDTADMHPTVTKYHLIDKTTFIRGQHLSGILQIINIPILVLKLLFLVPFLMQTKRFDIIHCQSGSLGLRLLPLHRLHLLHGKLIVQLRGQDITEVVSKNGKDVYKSLFKQADYFLPVCEYFRKQAINLGCPKEKISVMRLGINCKKFKFLSRKKVINQPVRILFIGRLVEKKGVEYAIKAISFLRHKNHHVELDIVGDGILKDKLQLLCRKLQVEKSVNFLGEKNQTQLIKILNKSHLLIAPSVTAKDGDQEGVPSAIKEAMACGMPVVSTYHSGIPELVKDGSSGFLVQERDAKALADRLDYLIQHPKLWAKMGKVGRIFVETNYNEEILTKQMIDLFLKLSNRTV